MTLPEKVGRTIVGTITIPLLLAIDLIVAPIIVFFETLDDGVTAYLDFIDDIWNRK